VGKFVASIERPKVKSFSFKPLDPLTKGSVPVPRWGLCPQTFRYRGLTVVFAGVSNSLAPALIMMVGDPCT